jgi:hypothetical protein
MTRLVLVEHVPATFLPEPGDTVVAMTPEACYELDGRGIPYRLTTDFGLDASLAALEPVHWREQLAWLESFDELLASHVQETQGWRLGAATLYGYVLKTVLDSVRFRALELDSMLDSCDRVLLHRRAEVDPPLSWRLSFQGPSVTSRVLPLVARARGVAFEEHTDETAAPVEVPTPLAGREQQLGFLRRLKNRVRSGQSALRHARSSLNRRRTRRLTLLFADFGYDLTYLLARAREQGHRCLRVVDDTVVEEGARAREVARLPVDGAAAGWVSAAAAVAAPDHPLWAWPNSWLAEAPLADVFRPRVLFWLSEVMPRVAARAAAFEDLLARENVDFVLGANIAKPDVPAAAAVTAAPTQSVLVDHGDGAFVSELFDLIMLRHVDHNFCSTHELAEYMESRGGLYDRPTATLQVGSYRWRANAALARSATPPLAVPEGRPVVVYALTATAGNGRYLNSPWYADAWYYRLCRELVDVLARHPDVFSVVKLFPGDGNLRNPIDLYVEDLGLDHVVSSRAPLRAWIPWADRVVFDFPSTGLYETAVAGVPFLALLYSHHRHRPEAVARLGPAAVRFTEPAEAAAAVDAFVTAPAVTAPRLDPEGDEILTTLERLATQPGG